MDAAMNVRLGIKTKAFNTKMKQLSWRLNKLGKRFTSIGKSITRNFTLPFALAGGAAVKLSMDFQKSMTRIQTLVGKTESEINSMKGSVLDIAKDTAQAPKDLADGLYYLESAGLRGANAMETLNAVAKGSAIGLADMESLSLIAAGAQNAYGKETLTAAQALDKFGVMVRTGLFESQELASTLGKQLGVTAELGISFDEVGAFIATYTRTTGDAAAASTALGAIMTTFTKLDAKPTETQAAALKKVGLNAADVKEMLGKEGLSKTMQTLKEKFDEQNITMGAFFGRSQAMRAALSVLGKQSKNYTMFLDDMADSTEFVGESFDITAKTGAFKMEQAMNNLKVAGTELGEALEPVVVAITDKITKLTNWFSSLDKKTKDVIITIGLTVAAIGPLTWAIGSIVTACGYLIPVIYSVGTAMLSITWTVALVIAALIGVVMAFAYIRENYDAFAERMGDWGWWKNSIIELIQFLLEHNPMSVIIGGFNELLTYFGKTTIPNPLAGMSEELEVFKEELKDYEYEFGSFTDAMKNQGGELVDFFKDLLPEIDFKSYGGQEILGPPVKYGPIEMPKGWKPFSMLFDELEPPPAITKSWEEIFEGIESGFEKVMKVAKQVFSSLGGLFKAQSDKEQAILDNKIAAQDKEYETWYERELMKIENSTKNEEEKNNAIAELDKVASTKKTDLEKRQDTEKKKIAQKSAKREKGMSIFDSIVNTASAIVNALGTGIPPYNFILAGIVGAMGAAQTAAIASTPIPALSEGGIAFGPTLAQVGEYKGASANPEVIAPLNKLKGMLNTQQSSKIEIFGRLDGNDIWLSNNLANTNRKRFT